MLEQAEKMSQFAGQVPSLQSKIDSVTENVNKMKFISPEDYVECESCGLLVNRVKAQVFSSVEWAGGLRNPFYTLSGSVENIGEKEAVLHHLCNHCDMKKFKKEKEY